MAISAASLPETAPEPECRVTHTIFRDVLVGDVGDQLRGLEHGNLNTRRSVITEAAQLLQERSDPSQLNPNEAMAVSSLVRLASETRFRGKVDERAVRIREEAMEAIYDVMSHQQAGGNHLPETISAQLVSQSMSLGLELAVHNTDHPLQLPTILELFQNKDRMFITHYFCKFFRALQSNHFDIAAMTMASGNASTDAILTRTLACELFTATPQELGLAEQTAMPAVITGLTNGLIELSRQTVEPDSVTRTALSSHIRRLDCGPGFNSGSLVPVAALRSLDFLLGASKDSAMICPDTRRTILQNFVDQLVHPQKQVGEEALHILEHRQEAFRIIAVRLAQSQPSLVLSQLLIRMDARSRGPIVEA